jgi:hypothetical protein
MASMTSDVPAEAPGDPVAHVTQVTLGGAALPGASVWARVDYSADAGFVTVQFTAQGPGWQPGTHAILTVGRSDGRTHELPVQVEEERWLGSVRRAAQLRLRVTGAAPWSEVEDLLSPGS